MKTTEIKEYLERLENLTKIIAELQSDMSELKKEMKAAGVDVKAAQNVIKMKLADTAKKEGEHISNVMLYAECFDVDLGFEIEANGAESAKKTSAHDSRVTTSKLTISDDDDDSENATLDPSTIAMNAELTDIPESLRRS